MDGFNEKKWFVYLGDHHEGPFSLAEIEAKMKSSLVTSSNFVWCEGMADWKVMTEISEFSGLLKPTTPSEIKVAEAPSVEPELPEPLLVEPVKVEPVENEPVEAEPRVILDRSLPVERQERRASVPEAERLEPIETRRSFGKLVAALFFLLLLAGGALTYTLGLLDPALQSPGMQAAKKRVSDVTHPYLIRAVEKYPLLGKWISPIPSLTDVSQEDLEGLKQAAGARMQAADLRVALALSRSDLLAPSFYIAANLPDAAKIDVFVVGIPDTLLNQTSFFFMSHAELIKRIGKTGPIHFSEGQALPRGEYMVYAMESDRQIPEIANLLSGAVSDPAKAPQEKNALLPKGRKLVAAKSYFLGGAKDNVYAERLREFHEKLGAKAFAELAEIKQFSSTLESQMATSLAKYGQLKKGKVTPAQKKAWSTFQKSWTRMNGQIAQALQKWTPEVLEKEYFYGSLYQLVIRAAQAVQRANGFHEQFFSVGVRNPTAFEIQAGEAMSFAQASLDTLKAKIEQAEKLGNTPNGMPRRDGL